MVTKLTAAEFTERLHAMQSDDELRKIQRFFKPDSNPQSKDDYFIGVKMGNLFALGKEFSEMPVAEIEKLMESPIHEVRAGAMSIMGQCAKGKRCSNDRLKELYELYLRRHDRINNWDLVDLAAYYVVGKHLADKPRDVLLQTRTFSKPLGAPDGNPRDRPFHFEDERDRRHVQDRRTSRAR
jgi:hypothetical protein